MQPYKVTNKDTLHAIFLVLDREGYETSGTVEVYADPMFSGVYAVRDTEREMDLLVDVNGGDDASVDEVNFDAWPPNVGNPKIL